MLDGPAPAMEFPRNPASVAFPGKFFGAYYCDATCGRNFFQFVYTHPERICFSISVVPALTQTAQFPAQKEVFQAFPAKQVCKILLRKAGDLTSGKTANIGGDIDSVRENYLDEILFTPIGGAKGENPF
jgi:hypothetical protein